MKTDPTYDELKERVHHLENLIKNMGTPVMLFDEAGILLMINNATVEHLGGTAEDYLGCSIESFMPGDSKKYLQHIKDACRSGKSATYENELVLGSGTLWFLTSYIPVFDKDGNVHAVQTVSIDITERKKAENALRENQEIFNRFMEHNPIYVFFKDEEIRAIHLSKNYEQLLGLPIAEILGKTMDEIFPSDLAKNMIADDKHVLGEGKMITVVEELNGRFYETIKFPIELDGRPKYLAGYTIDITDKKKTREKLEGNILFLKTLLDTIPSPIFYTDKEHQCLGGNRAWSEGILGMNIEDIIGHTVEELYKKASKEDVGEKRFGGLELINTGGERLLESRIKCNDEKWRDFIIYKSTYPDSEGKVAGIVGVMLDITEQKRAAEEKTILQKRLQQAQRMESIGTLAGGIAHDFNNILLPIMAFSELAAMKLPSESPIRHDLNQIQRAAERARDLVKQILTFARQQETERAPIKISTILKETVKLLRSSIPTTIDLKCNIDVSHDIVLADPTKINEIIMNLSTNAAQTMEDTGGAIEIILVNEDINPESAKTFTELEPGLYARLTVKDTGHGIHPQIMEKIFEPYFTTKAPGKGTGMGLSIVHGIVKNYGGEITVQSEIFKGTTFNVYLPVIQTNIDIKEKAKDLRPVPTGIEHILAVDDLKVSLDTLQSMLEWLGYKVTARTSSVEALEAFKNNPKGFDLVITDQTMPNMTGKMLIKEMMAINSNMPFILCTGFSEQIDEKRAKEMGIDAFIMKPIVIDQLAKIIRDVLDTKSPQKS